MRSRITEIDRAFASNDVERLKAVVAGDAAALKRNLECELRHALSNATILSQQSEIVKALRIGSTDAVYAVVTTTLRPKPSKDMAWNFDRRGTHGRILFFRPGQGGPALARASNSGKKSTRAGC